MLQEFIMFPLWVRAAILLGVIFGLWVALGKYAIRMLSFFPFCIRHIARAIYLATSFAIGKIHNMVDNALIDRIDSGWTDLARAFDSWVGAIYGRMRAANSRFAAAAFLVCALLSVWIALPQQLGINDKNFQIAYEAFSGFENWLVGGLAGREGPAGTPLPPPQQEESQPDGANGASDGDKPPGFTLVVENGAATMRITDDALPAGAGLEIGIGDEKAPLPPAPMKLVSEVYAIASDGQKKEFMHNGTLEIKLDASSVRGNPIDDLAIYYYDQEAGKWVYLGGEIDTENMTLAAQFGRFANVAVFSNPSIRGFIDVTRDHWAYAYVRRLAALEAIRGYYVDEGIYEFLPDIGITRSEAISMIVTSLGLPLAESSGRDERFSDWDSTKKMDRPYISAAIDAGIISAPQAGAVGTIDADNCATRQEIAVMMVRALGDKAAGGLGMGGLEKIRDFDDIEDWAKDAFVFAVGAGMIKTDGFMALPNAIVTRAEAAMAMCKTLELMMV